MTTETPSTPPGATAPPSGGSNRFFDWFRSIQLTREPGWLGGVAAGVALRIGIDVAIVRGILVVLALFGAPVLIVYAAAWMLLPDHGGRIHAEQLGKGVVEPPVAGAAVLVLLALVPGWGGWLSAPWAWFGPVEWGIYDFGDVLRILWTLALIGSGIWLLVWAVSQSQRGAGGGAPSRGASSPAEASADAATTGAEPAGSSAEQWTAAMAADRAARDSYASATEEERRAADAERIAQERRERAEYAAEARERYRRTRSNPLFTLAAVGLALVSGSIVTVLVGGFDVTQEAIVAGLATAIGILGLAIVLNGAMGKRSGGSSPIAVLLTIGLLFTAVPPVNGQVLLLGTAQHSPSFLAQAEASYVIGAGRTVVDLSDYWEGVPASAVETGAVRIVSGAGDVTVQLPRSGSLSLSVVHGLGEVTLAHGGGEAQSISSRTSELSIRLGARPEQVIRLEIVSGAGNVLITDGEDPR